MDSICLVYNIADSYSNVTQNQIQSKLIATDFYYLSMPLTKVLIRSRIDCLVLCASTMGCLFYNHKIIGDTQFCHFADPLHGEALTTRPDDGLGWNVYYILKR